MRHDSFTYRGHNPCICATCLPKCRALLLSLKECGALLIAYRAVLKDYRALLIDNGSLFIDYRAFLREYRALLTDYRALLIEYRALLRDYRALLTDYRALLIDYRALLRDYRALLIDYRAIWDTIILYICWYEHFACYTLLVCMRVSWVMSHIWYRALLIDYRAIWDTIVIYICWCLHLARYTLLMYITCVHYLCTLLVYITCVYEGLMSHVSYLIYANRVSHMNASCLYDLFIYESCLVSDIWQSCLTYEQVIEAWRILLRDMTLSHVQDTTPS